MLVVVCTFNGAFDLGDDIAIFSVLFNSTMDGFEILTGTILASFWRTHASVEIDILTALMVDEVVLSEKSVSSSNSSLESAAAEALALLSFTESSLIDALSLLKVINKRGL